MAMTIYPAGRGITSRFVGLTGVFSVGVFIGGALAIAAATALLGGVSLVSSRAVAPVVAMAIVALGLLREVGIPVPMPFRHRQVPESWRGAFPAPLAAGVYGTTLGVGFATPYTSSVFLAMIVVAPFVSSPVILLAVLMTYSVSKTAVLLSGVGRGADTSITDCIVSTSRADVGRRWLRRAAAVVASGVALAALAGGVNWP
jgi:hypothetical protein